jgi:hypothetical protein
MQTDLRRISELGDAIVRNRRNRIHHEVCLRYAKSRSCDDDDGVEVHIPVVFARVAATYELSKVVDIVARGVVAEIERHPNRGPSLTIPSVPSLRPF